MKKKRRQIRIVAFADIEFIKEAEEFAQSLNVDPDVIYRIALRRFIESNFEAAPAKKEWVKDSLLIFTTLFGEDISDFMSYCKENKLKMSDTLRLILKKMIE